MSKKVKVWTKQHKDILKDLNDNGRYIVKKQYIENKMEDHSDLYFNSYNWFRNRAKEIVPVPDDVEFPIWVSVTEESKIPNSEGNVLLEIEVDEDLLITMDLDKWGYIVNYMYIPKDKEDEENHAKILKSYGIDDTRGYMSNFYPNIKNKIVKSWERLFDDSIILSDARVGTLWEIKKEWITKISK